MLTLVLEYMIITSSKEMWLKLTCYCSKYTLTGHGERLAMVQQTHSVQPYHTSCGARPEKTYQQQHAICQE